MNKPLSWGQRTCLVAIGSMVAFLLFATSGLGQEKKQSGEIPEVKFLQSLQGEYEPANFGHKLHAEKAKTCASCHHHSSAEETRKCAECHDLEKMAIKDTLLENFLPCKSCHRKYNPASPMMPGLMTAFHAQCFSCHKVEGPKACEKMCHARAVKQE